MFRFKSSIDYSGFTLIVPSVCVGNVSQLSMDLLIEALKMQKIGNVWDPAIIPIIGPAAFQNDKDDNELTTAAEFYVSIEKKILVLQIRSPLVAAVMELFFEKIVDFIKIEKIQQLVLLTSSYAHEKHQIGSNAFEFCPNEKFTTTKNLLELGWSKSDQEVILGGGFAIKLQKIATREGISSITFFKYVSEGNNSPDAKEFVLKLNNFMELIEKNNKGIVKLVTPISWKYLFGNDVTANMY